MRLRCHLFGCIEAAGAPCCDRCAAYIYDPAFVEAGRLDPVRRLWRRLVFWRWPRCWGCGRRLWPWSRRVGDDFCSQGCFDSWLPF